MFYPRASVAKLGRGSIEMICKFPQYPDNIEPDIPTIRSILVCFSG